MENYFLKGAKDTTDVFTGHIETDQGLSEGTIERFLYQFCLDGDLTSKDFHDPRKKVDPAFHCLYFASIDYIVIRV